MHWLVISMFVVLGCGRAAGTSRIDIVDSAVEGNPQSTRIELRPVQQGGKTRHAILLRNRSNRDLRIDRFESSCECANVSPPSLALRDGAESAVTLCLDLTLESEFTGLLAIDISAYDEHDHPILVLTASVEVNPQMGTSDALAP